LLIWRCVLKIRDAIWIIPICGFYIAITEKDPGLFFASLGVSLILLGLVLIPGFLASEREKRACERWVEQQREKEGREAERGVDPKKRLNVYHCSSCNIYIVDKDANFCKHRGDTLQKL
jgi:uncharacterized protein (DUF58 family)